MGCRKKGKTRTSKRKVRNELRQLENTQFLIFPQWNLQLSSLDILFASIFFKKSYSSINNLLHHTNNLKLYCVVFWSSYFRVLHPPYRLSSLVHLRQRIQHINVSTYSSENVDLKLFISLLFLKNDHKVLLNVSIIFLRSTKWPEKTSTSHCSVGAVYLAVHFVS